MYPSCGNKGLAPKNPKASYNTDKETLWRPEEDEEEEERGGKSGRGGNFILGNEEVTCATHRLALVVIEQSENNESDRGVDGGKGVEVDDGVDGGKGVEVGDGVEVDDGGMGVEVGDGGKGVEVGDGVEVDDGVDGVDVLVEGHEEG